MKSVKTALVLGGAVGLLGLATGRSRAAVLTWDINQTDGPAITPGDGTWDLTTPNWNNGTTNVVWPNSTGTNSLDAAFAGADGTYAVNVANSLNAGSLTFTNSGYTLSAASPVTITLAGNVNVASGKTATIGNNVIVNRATAYNLQGGGSLIIDSGGTVTSGGNPLAVLTPTTVLTGGKLQTTGGTSIAGSVNSLLTVAGGTVAPTGLLVIANASNSTGTVTLNAGAVSLQSSSGGLRVAGGSTSSITNTAAVFNLNGGVLTTPKIFVGLGANAVSTFNFNGGTLRPNISSTTFMAGLTTANVRSGGAVIDTQGNSVTIAQPLLHEAALGATADGGLQKLGTGALTLTGANTYTGPSRVSAGALLVNGTHNGAGSYSVTGGAASPATLGGAGTINLAQAASNLALSSSSAAPADNAVLSPGAAGAGSIGTLTVNGGGNVVLGDNSTMLVDFSGASSDRLTTDGAIDFTSPSNTLNLVGSGSGTFTIAQFAAYAGGLPSANQFENVLLNGTPTQSSNPAGDNYVSVAYNANDITVTANVPEPGLFGLLGLSAISLLPRRRRRLRHAPHAVS
jgi:autotransporter-associated beta strand protein